MDAGERNHTAGGDQRTPAEVGRKSWANRHPVATVAIVVAAFLIIIGALSGGSQNNNPAPAAPAQQAAATQPSNPCDSFSKNTATSSITYKELDKDPAAYDGTAAVYSGQVVQIMESPDGSGLMRLAITKNEFGWDTSNILLVTYQGHTSAVQDDVVKVYGYLSGSQTYTSQANWQITVPSMEACEIDDVTQAQATTPQATSPQASPSAPSANQPITPAPAAQTPPPASGSWHTVLTYTGPDTQNTAPFAMRGSQWRITYSCTLNPSQYGGTSSLFQGIINSAADGSPTDIFVNGPCPQNNTSYSYGNPPGPYALQVQSFNASYSITIQDYY